MYHRTNSVEVMTSRWYFDSPLLTECLEVCKKWLRMYGGLSYLSASTADHSSLCQAQR